MNGRWHYAIARLLFISNHESTRMDAKSNYPVSVVFIRAYS
ncbi:MAG TPA: hypothetical protein PLE77_08185 [Kiritimatiellia bacterium]|nr:hypothetical protein [Kiritimatiellia bacterium]